MHIFSILMHGDKPDLEDMHIDTWGGLLRLEGTRHFSCLFSPFLFLSGLSQFLPHSSSIDTPITPPTPFTFCTPVFDMNVVDISIVILVIVISWISWCGGNCDPSLWLEQIDSVHIIQIMKSVATPKVDSVKREA